MKRRTLLAGLAGMIAGGTGVTLLTDTSPDVPVPSVNVSNPLTDDGAKNTLPQTQSLSGPFDEITFHPDGTATLSFNSFHEIDGWYLIYHEQSRVENGIYFCEAPKGDGTAVTARLIEAIRHQQRQYPDRRFNLVAARGAFPRCDLRSGFSYIEARVHTATITIPSQFQLSKKAPDTDAGANVTF